MTRRLLSLSWPKYRPTCVCVRSCENLRVFKVNFKSGKNELPESNTSMNTEYNDKSSCQLALETSLWSPCAPHSAQSINLEHTSKWQEKQSLQLFSFSHSPDFQCLLRFRFRYFCPHRHKMTHRRKVKRINSILRCQFVIAHSNKPLFSFFRFFSKSTKFVFLFHLIHWFIFFLTFNDWEKKSLY